MLTKVLHMSNGDQKKSYANNSAQQKIVILKTLPILQDALKKLYDENGGLPKCLKITDFGCASGLNTFVVISEIVDTVYALCAYNNITTEAPELQIYLTDLPDNDFNSIFKAVPSFNKNLVDEKGGKFKNCFIAGVPGSFYDRLFPRESLNFVFSSYSVHWFSQVPAELENKRNVFMSSTSPPVVFKTYLRQFQRDFATFLRLRAEEIVKGGRMVLTFIARSIQDPMSKDCCAMWDLLTKSLLDMMYEGLIQEEDVNTFNISLYAPYKDEVKEIVQEEGSFNIERLHVYECNWDQEEELAKESFVFDKHRSGNNMADLIRAVTEPMLVSHFKGINLDVLFQKYAQYVAEHLSVEKTKRISISISLSKK